MALRHVCALALSVECVLAASSARAQSIEAGIKGGVTFASLSDFAEAVGDPGLDTTSKAGVVIGGYIGYRLAENLFIAPEVLFVQKGIKISGGAEGLPADSAVKLSYLEIPVPLQYRFGTGAIKPYAFGGPALGFNTGAHASGALFGMQGQDVDVADQVRDIEWSIVAGGGVMAPRWLAELRFSRGLSAANESVPVELARDIHTTAFTMVAGVRF